jgi:flagellar basal-body rod modification protein FlgD
MTISSVFGAANTAATSTSTSSKVGKGMGSMDASDFLKLLTTQMQYQDPTAPVDNKDMLAQMAQFTSLSSTTEMNSTLKAIAIKVGAIPDTTGATDTGTDTGITA